MKLIDVVMFLLEFGIIWTTVSLPEDQHEDGAVSVKDLMLTQSRSSRPADPRDRAQALVTERQRSFMHLVITRMETWTTVKQVCDFTFA